MAQRGSAGIPLNHAVCRPGEVAEWSNAPDSKSGIELAASRAVDAFRRNPVGNLRRLAPPRRLTYNGPMLEKIVHWLIFLAIVCFVVASVYQLVTTGSLQEACCAID